MESRPPNRGASRGALRRAAIAATSVLAAAGLVTIAVSQAHAAASCTVAYQTQNDWGAGATININITNNGPATTSWTLAFSFSGNQKVTQGWNGTYTQSGQNVSVASLSYNGALATGASTSTGFNLSYTGTNQAPTSFTLNGNACAGGGGNPPPTTTTTPPSTTTGTTTTTTTTTTTGGGGGTHVSNPFVGSTPYLNPDYVKEVQTQASADGSASEAAVAKYPTAIWLDTMSAIAGGNGRTGLQAQMDNALAQSASGPTTIEIVVYDLPGRDCAALASNGEIPATSAGLTTYETNYIDPITSILSQSKYVNSNLRVVAVIEPDSLPNMVTNLSKSACATAQPFYESGIEYALNHLHPINNVYLYMDIAHSAWLGWPNNLQGTGPEYQKVVGATSAGLHSIDGFITDTANYTPLHEPYMTATQTVGGQQVMSANFYQFNPDIEESTYIDAMYTELTGVGFPTTIGFLVDTSRNGWGGSARPTGPGTATDVNTFVSQSKIDKRPFRGDWCNQNGAGIGPRPQANPSGAGISSHIIAFVWIKPPGESDGDYPTSTHSHGDPHCDPSGTNTDGNGGTYSTGSIPGFDVPAGQWFAAEFQQLVANAFPSMS